MIFDGHRANSNVLMQPIQLKQNPELKVFIMDGPDDRPTSPALVGLYEQRTSDWEIVGSQSPYAYAQILAVGAGAVGLAVGVSWMAKGFFSPKMIEYHLVPPDGSQTAPQESSKMQMPQTDTEMHQQIRETLFGGDPQVRYEILHAEAQNQSDSSVLDVLKRDGVLQVREVKARETAPGAWPGTRDDWLKVGALVAVSGLAWTFRNPIKNTLGFVRRGNEMPAPKLAKGRIVPVAKGRPSKQGRPQRKRYESLTLMREDVQKVLQQAAIPQHEAASDNIARAPTDQLQRFIQSRQSETTSSVNEFQILKLDHGQDSSFPVEDTAERRNQLDCRLANLSKVFEPWDRTLDYLNLQEEFPASKDLCLLRLLNGASIEVRRELLRLHMVANPVPLRLALPTRRWCSELSSCMKEQPVLFNCKLVDQPLGASMLINRVWATDFEQFDLSPSMISYVVAF